ncbi:MAG: Rrf2 family transcriptional regulator [Xanthobacteraceae bacterium]|nr:MAG: Rrf2 family transcriptional regulator [Xanthobacteraceae bacterium]
MRLTVYTDYSLRVLMFLALKDEGLSTVAEIAKTYGISKNHLMKVAHQLGVAGYVETVRGKGGGMRLARQPQDICIGEVVRHTEPDMEFVPCFDSEDTSCTIVSSCALRGSLSRARDAFLSVLDEQTLADLVRPRAALHKLLSITPEDRAATRRGHPAQRT